jgi:hypothetical protein
VGDDKTGQWGFIDKRGTIVIRPQFDETRFFSDDVCAVRVGGDHGRWGFIDTHGQYVINPQFAYMEYPGFVDGLAKVGVDDEFGKRKLGMIDKRGDFVIPPKFDVIDEFHEGLVVATSLRSDRHPQSAEYLNKHGRTAFAVRLFNGGDFDGGLAPASIQGTGFRYGNAVQKWGIINHQGRFVVPAQYDSIGPFSEGLSVVGIGTIESLDDASARFGFIDRDGAPVIPLQFNHAFSFHDGLALVGIGSFNTGRWGFIAKDGRFALNPTFSQLSEFKGGLAAASADGKKFGFIDKSGTFVITPTYDYALDFSEGYATVGVKYADHVKWGLVNTKGVLVVQPISDEQILFSEDMAEVKVNGKWGYIARRGS